MCSLVLSFTYSFLNFKLQLLTEKLLTMKLTAHPGIDPDCFSLCLPISCPLSFPMRKSDCSGFIVLLYRF